MTPPKTQKHTVLAALVLKPRDYVLTVVVNYYLFSLIFSYTQKDLIYKLHLTALYCKKPAGFHDFLHTVLQQFFH